MSFLLGTRARTLSETEQLGLDSSEFGSQNGQNLVFDGIAELTCFSGLAG
jgi:hypothetical protein